MKKPLSLENFKECKAAIERCSPKIDALPTDFRF